MLEGEKDQGRPVAGTLGEILYEAESRTPNSTALIQGERSVTYNDLLEQVERFATCLTEVGVRRGDPVALLIGNSIPFCVTHYAAAQLGAIVVPINVHLKGALLHYVLERSDAVAVVTSTALAAQLRSLPGIPPRLRVLVAWDGEAGDGAGTVTAESLQPGAAGAFRRPLEGFPRLTAGPVAAPDDDAIIFFTSGTTGRPKGILVTHRQALIGIDCWADRWEFDQRTVSLMIAPFFHVVYNPLVLGAHRHGGCSVALERLSIRPALHEIERTRVTAVMGNPAVFMQLLRDPRRQEHDLSSLDTVIYGAAPMPVPVIHDLRVVLPQARFYNCYGLSETCSAISCLGPEDTEARPNSIGRPHPGVEVAILDENGEPLGATHVGEICCRGANVMKGYYRAPEETRHRFVNGWLKTGDLGYLDPDGYLHILDRVDDLIIIAGEKVYPREVEDVLYAHPDVVDAAVAGREHATKGQMVTAFIVPRAGVELRESDLRRFCAERLPPSAVPRAIEFVTAVPRNPSGKVLRSALS